MLFKSESDILDKRINVNANFRNTHPNCSDFFLPIEDEHLLCRKFERELLRFCSIFEDPPLFRSIKCTAMNYFKRFYLKYSAMEYYPQNVMLLCVYLACKVEEYNICIDKFVAMLEQSLQYETGLFIIAHEFILMEALDYSLIVHNAFKPLDGFILELSPKLEIEKLAAMEKQAKSFINDAILTDSILLYPPSQVALAAITYASEQHDSRNVVNEYLAGLCLNEDTQIKLTTTLSNVRRHLQHNYKFQITSSKLKEIEFKCKSINKLMALSQDNNSSSDENVSSAAPIVKRRRTDDEED